MDVHSEVIVCAYILVSYFFKECFCLTNGCSGQGDWSVYDRQCYSCIANAVPWQTARSSCQQIGADLVTIKTAGTQSFLENLCPNTRHWIGLNDIASENNFVWVKDSTPVSYTNWNSGEPNNSGDEDCVHILEDTKKWNDLNCASTNPYICQKPQDIDYCAELPCQNNGTCIDLLNDYNCICLNGFNGANCTINIDDCLPDPCQNNGTCTDLVNDYQCGCVEGFNGRTCENNIDDCLPDPCQHNGTCTDLVNDYHCNCVAGFNGINCENNIDECAVQPCQNNGTCVDLINDYQCSCINGFNWKNCTNNIDECLPDPCQNNGTCFDLVNDFRCNCVTGFNGTHCENNIDECMPDPCQHNATCRDLVNDYHCDCVEGFNGTNCENNIDECAVQPCQNNGTCVDLINDYQCSCIDGFDGKNCTNNINECMPDPCQHNATCRDLVNDYHCDCVEGFNGTNCENNINECAVQPCQNNGSCVDLINDYQCSCIDGFNGKNCTNNIDDCLPDPCKNKGTCTDLVNDYQCDCMAGFNGTNCENNIDDCIPNSCKNNGTCTDLVNDYQCDCVSGYNGTDCEHNIDECEVQPCQNNGTCIDLINNYQCYCTDGFNGTNCTTDIDECATQPCQNNGSCLDIVNDYRCFCTNGFTGMNCANDTYILQVLNFESSSSVLHEGKSVWFKLELRSKTMYEVQWFHTGYLIANPSRRYKVTSLETENNTSIHTLNIANVLQRDMGTWKITVSNTVTNSSRNLTLKVIPKLMLKMNPEYDFSILRGEEISLQCTVINPEALFDVINGSLVMTKDGSALPDVDISNFSTTWKKYTGMEVDSGRYTCTHSGYHVPVNVSVYVTVIQPEQKRCESEWSEGVLWNATLAGTTKQEPCPSKEKGTATRYCEPLGMWASPNLINCTTEAFTNASLQLDSLMEDGIQNTEKVQETVNNTLQMMKNITSSTNELSAGDLSSSLDILEKIVDVSNSTGSTIEKEVFYAVIDNVLSVNNSKSWTTVSEKTQKDASSILKNMERLSEVLIRSDNITATQFSGSNFDLTINQTKIDEAGLRFPDVSTNNLSGSSEQTPTYFVLPKQDSKAEKAINYVAVIYKTMSNILPSDSDSSDQIRRDLDQTSTKEEFVNSPILSLTTQNDLGVLIPPLNLTFGHVNINESSNMQAVCVSWDFTKNKWTERGCKMNQSDNKRTVCQCNHLTNFAILMRPYSPATEDKQSLKTMSLVGVILSISFTALTCVIYILTWRYIKSDQNILMLNLCGSLILSYVFFISAVEQTKNEGACMAITAIIHYLFLVTFFSMLGMGVYYFMSITVTYYAMYVANNFKSISRVHWFLLTIYGIPVIITTTTLGAFWGKDYHLKYYCWLSPKSGSLYLFIIPVCLISMFNLLIIVSLVRVLCASSAMIKSSLQKKATSGLRSLGTLLPVLGVTWLFGILAVNERADVFQYIFVIANSLQGFFIFVSHVLLNKKVMQGLKNRYPVLTTLISITEHSKTETTSVSHSQSSSKSNALLFTMKKKGIFERLRNKTVKKSDSVLTEKTTSTDCCSSVSHEKSLVMSEYESTNNTLKLISEEENTRGRFWFSFSLNPWKKKYTVTEM